MGNYNGGVFIPMTKKQIDYCGDQIEEREDGYYLSGTSHKITEIPHTISTVPGNPYLTKIDREKLEDFKYDDKYKKYRQRLLGQWSNDSNNPQA